MTMATWRRVRRASIPLVCLLLAAGPVSAAPTVSGLSAEPSTVQINAATAVTVTITIPDPSVIVTGVYLQRINTNGSLTTLGVMRDDGTGGDAVAGDRIFTLTLAFNEPQTGRIRLQASAAFRGVLRRAVSEPLTVPIGVLVPPAFGATIPGPGGTTLVVPPQSIDVEVVAGISPAPPAAIVAPVGNLPLATAVDIMFEPTELNGALLLPSDPLQISVPAPAGTAPGQAFIVAQQMQVDATDGTGLSTGLIATAVAAAVGTSIQTQGSVLPGIRQSGTYAVVTATGSGFVTGVVTLGGEVQSGVVVSSNTNPLVAITDDDGRFSLFISGDAFTLTAFHPLRGARGTATGNIGLHGSTVVANILLAPLQTPALSRDGIRNGGFERCTASDVDGRGNLTGSWLFAGDARAVRQFQALSGETILPTEGKCLALIGTGPEAQSAGATLRQRFIVPAGVRTLRFDFQFLSEELEEWVGTAFDDVFEARVTTPEQDTLVSRVQVNDFFDPATFGARTADFVAIGNCVAGGDDTCGRAGWRTGEIDLSRFAAVDRSVTVDLAMAISDRGDSLFDSHVLIDNIRFGTIWVDAKIISGANANAQRVEAEMLGATEVLSQAGLNVQLRRILPVADPANLTDVDTTWAPGTNPCPSAVQFDGRLTTEEAQGMALARGVTTSDLNIYYVRSSTRFFDGVAKTVGIAGYGIGPDEFCNEVTLLGNAGVFQMDFALGRLGVLPHEMGHVLISADAYNSTLEHSVVSIDPSNIMIGAGVPANGVVNRKQSANINRLGNPLIVP
jgi:hypothetical protein